MDDGYLQIKIRELNEKIIELEQKEKLLLIRYEKMENFYNFNLETIFKDIELIKKVKKEIDELPKKLFEFNKEEMDKIINIKLEEKWNGVIIKELKNLFITQSKINSEEFKQMAKRYIADNLDFEIQLGAIRNILLNRKIITKKDIDRWGIEYKKRVKPLVKQDLGLNSEHVSGDLKIIDKIIGSDFEFIQKIDDLMNENEKIIKSMKTGDKFGKY